MGDDLAGNRVWADGSPPVESVPLLKEPDDCKQEFTEDFTACVVTCTMSRVQSDSTVQFSSVLFLR